MEATHLLTDTAEAREMLFTELYKKTFPAVARYVQRMGGSLEEAKDVFHDALVLYYEKTLRGEKMVLQEHAYLLGISKHLWTKQFKEKIRYTPMDLSEKEFPTLSKDLHPSGEKLLLFLETAGKKCMDLLQAFYYEKRSLEELAGTFGFSGIRSATVQKYKCLEKVRETIKEKSLGYEDFLD